jgi:hypothetical protein
MKGITGYELPIKLKIAGKLHFSYVDVYDLFCTSVILLPSAARPDLFRCFITNIKWRPKAWGVTVTVPVAGTALALA